MSISTATSQKPVRTILFVSAVLNFSCHYTPLADYQKYKTDTLFKSSNICLSNAVKIEREINFLRMKIIYFVLSIFC